MGRGQFIEFLAGRFDDQPSMAHAELITPGIQRASGLGDGRPHLPEVVRVDHRENRRCVRNDLRGLQFKNGFQGAAGVGYPGGTVRS